jgi:TM2 domain-containing membrane protein YozV
MKDKNVAGILALFLGWLGFHRFYLGQTGLGVLYLIFCWFPLIWLIAFVDAISLFSMDQQKFNDKYNKSSLPAYPRRDTDFERPPARRYQQQPRQQAPQYEPLRKTGPEKPNPYKKSGLDKFKDYDYAGAIEDFEKSIEIAPRDIATHFNLACAYSLTENAPKSFYHLDKAVENGFQDFQKIKEHHALAYIRIQKEFDTFEKNKFRLMIEKPSPTEEENLLGMQPDLLDQLKKLGDLREKGLLTEQEFSEQKKKLLG